MTPAERGAAWLDQQSSDWYTGIDTKRLDLDHADRCILGQSIGWSTGCRLLASSNGCADVVAYGFISSNTCVEADWITEIERRRTPVVFMVADETPPTRTPYLASTHCVPAKRRSIRRHRVPA